MNWIKKHRGPAVICAVTIFIPVFLYLYVLQALLSMRAEYQQSTDRLQPRIARLQGLVEREQDLLDSSDELRLQMARLIYPAELDRASISTGIQKELKQMFSDAGMSVSNSQVLPMREEGRFDHGSVRYTVTGSISGLDDSLKRIAEYSPMVLVEVMEIWPKRDRKGQPETQNITANLKLLSLRAVE